MTQTLASRRYTLATDLKPGHHERLAGALARPELQTLHEGLRLSVDAGIRGFSESTGPDEVVLHPRALGATGLLAFVLRRELELRLLRRLDRYRPEPVRAFMRRLLALHTALCAWKMLTRRERESVVDGADPQLQQLLAGMATGGLLQAPAVERCQSMGRYLLTATSRPDDLGGLTLDSPETSTAVALAAGLLQLACPADYLLTTGGDDRLHLDDENGLNGYGCSPRPRPWAITFSSSTASSISDYAFSAVEAWRRDALASGLNGKLQDHLRRQCDEVRGRIARMLELEQETEVLLTSSGTDAELLALWLTMPRWQHGGVTNVIIGPAEVGSGTLAAGGGQHFSDATPAGSRVPPGTPLDGLQGRSIRVEQVPVRCDSGETIDDDAIEASLDRIARQAAERDDSVLLHLLDASKTGLSVPALTSVDRLLDAHPQIIAVVVDAAQMRLSSARLRDYLRRGFLVIVTGSKFYTGPPFSGALLVPPGWPGQAHGRLPPLAAGFAHYSTRSDFPDGLTAYGQSLPHGPNLGLLARWIAALWEVSAFHAVPASRRRATIIAFGNCVRSTIDTLDNLQLLAAPSRSTDSPDASESWDAPPSIFTYVVLKGTGASAPLDLREGRLAYRWLNSDIREKLPPEASAEERQVAATCCHTGQPVAYAASPAGKLAGLRVSAGARLISGTEFDPQLGSSPTERLARELEGIVIVLRKANLIGRYWDRLNQRAAIGSTTEPAFDSER